MATTPQQPSLEQQLRDLDAAREQSAQARRKSEKAVEDARRAGAALDSTIDKAAAWLNTVNGAGR